MRTYRERKKKQGGHFVGLWVPKELMGAVNAVVIKEDRTVSQIVRLALRAYLEPVRDETP